MHSWSKFKRARSADSSQFTGKRGRHDESETDPDENAVHFRNPDLGKYTHKNRVKESFPKHGFKLYSSERVYCSNNVSDERKFLDKKKQSLVDNIRPYANWSDEGSSASRERVKGVLKSYGETLEKLEKEAKSKGKKSNMFLHKDAIRALQHKWVNTAKRLGSVSGVKIGDRFQYRAELYVIGLHLQLQKGIDYMTKDGSLLATSIVATDKYSNQMKSSGVLIYSGHGGNPKVHNQQRLRDQVLEQGNLALKNSKDKKTPVRVILTESRSSIVSSQKKKTGTAYVYDGLYFVEKFCQERGEFGKLVFKYELRRIPGQPEGIQGFLGISGKCKSSTESRIVNDISQGKEKIPIAVVNTVDNERPPQFTYIAHIGKRSLSMPSGCDCPDQCSSVEHCSCKAKNGQEIPYDDNKLLSRRNPCIYECGSSCKCSDSCVTRVVQNGIQLQLEVFKTESKGWGVRSRSYIRAGSFICEYLGNIVRANEAYQNCGRDECLFDIGDNYDDRIIQGNRSNCVRGLRLHNSRRLNMHKKDWGFTIDAGQRGNVGRFINHCCSPNLFVQNVVYDDDDSGIPHVVLFAKRNIAPKTELTYDYNCRLGEFRYINGNVEAKNCLCKSPNCAGKFY